MTKLVTHGICETISRENEDSEYIQDRQESARRAAVSKAVHPGCGVDEIAFNVTNKIEHHATRSASSLLASPRHVILACLAWMAF